MTSLRSIAGGLTLPASVRGVFAANVYGQFVTLLIALVSVPAFLSFWTIEEYGRWLLLLAIPSYLSSCDFGIAAAATNRLVMGQGTLSADDREEIFHSTVFALTLISVAVTLVYGALAYLLKDAGILQERLGTVLALSLLTAVTLLGNLVDAVMRANGKFAAPVYISNSIRLGESAASLAAAYLIGSFFAAAWSMALTRVLLTGVAAFGCSRTFDSPTWGFARFSVTELRNTSRAAASFAIYPVSNALIFQGLSFVVGALAGPAALVVFNCYRTVTRLATQILGALNRSYWPEFSLAFGENAANRFRTLFHQCSSFNIGLACSASIVTLLAGEYVMEVWTAGQVGFDLGYFGLLVLGTAVTGFWQAHWVAMMAVNKHELFSLLYFVSAGLLVAVASFGLLIFGAGWAVAAAILLHEIALLLASRLTFRDAFRNLLMRN